MSAEPILDVEAIDLDQPEPQRTEAVSMALAPRERRSEVIRPLDADQLIESFAAYQSLLPKLLDASDYQDAGRGKRFVKKSGWRKIATAFDLDVQLIRSAVERDENGQPTRAEVWARAIAPSGRSMDGDGYCSVDEERFSGPRGNKSKLENDLRATATTRAMNRAISGLVGMGDVSAEEVGGPEDHGVEAEASPDLKRMVRGVLMFLLDEHEQHVSEAANALSTQFEARLPASAGQALVILGSAVKRHREGVVRDAPSDVPGAGEGEFKHPQAVTDGEFLDGDGELQLTMEVSPS